jgi:RNA polymerase sigma-70 factor (sigma-E family)
MQPNAAAVHRVGMGHSRSADLTVRDAQFDAYVAARSRRLLGVATMLVGRRDAEDALQDALISLYRRWDRVTAADNPDAYVHRSLVNASLQLLRRRRRIELPPSVDLGGHADAVSDRQQMLQALATLPPRQRAVLVLAFYEDRSEAEIADAMGCSRGTVKSQKARALNALRARLDSEDDERTYVP